MKDRLLRIRIEQCLALQEASKCVRRKFAAMLIDPERNTILMDAYNGGPRGGHQLCGGEGLCLRRHYGIPSGTKLEIGCHHAEQNLICNCAAQGIKTAGAWLIVTGEPCQVCAKIIHHAGISKVILVTGRYSTNDGLIYLEQNKVEIQYYNLQEHEKALL